MAIHEIARPFQRWIFVSYSHRDEYWKDRLLTHLKPLEKSCGAEIFCDDRIDTGDEWDETIKHHLQGANAAVLLISPDFLASKYISDNELPVLLARAREERGELHVLPVIVRPCVFEEVTFEYPTGPNQTEQRLLSEIEAVNDPKRPLNCLSEHEQDEVLAAIARTIATRFRELDRPPVVHSTAHLNPTRNVDVSRMPRGSSLFSGRDRELDLLDTWLEDRDTRVATIVAQGGEGKSALVSYWLRLLGQREWPGIGPAFAWSFYSQGTSDDRVAADDFMGEALTRFGDRSPMAGHPEDKGKRLAELLIEQSGLLILDGLEPLQQGRHESRLKPGQIKDPAIAALIATLAKTKEEMKGLCLITTRVPVADLDGDQTANGLKSLDLKALKREEGAWLLKLLGVKGSFMDLRRQSRHASGHPLSLLLLGTYLRNTKEPGPSKGQSPDFQRHFGLRAKNDAPFPAQLRWSIATYDRIFNSTPHRDVLLMLGLFDRPASAGEINALRRGKKGDGIPGLSDRVARLPREQWMSVLNRLRRAGLINEQSAEDFDELDAHPLVREYFASVLQESGDQDLWRKGHAILYRFLGKQGQLPNELQKLMLRYQAVKHAALAGKLQHALKNVYWRAIQKGRTGYAHRVFGTFATELSMLRLCFDDPDWTRPKHELSDFWRAHVLGLVGSRLRALGRLEEAVEPLEASRDRHEAAGHLLYAAIRTRHLCELHVELGRLEAAEKYGKEVVRIAETIDEPQSAELQRQIYAEELLRPLAPEDGKYERLVANVVFGAALHQSGKWTEAGECFDRAIRELGSKPDWPKIPVLFGLWGFRYCEYLFDKAEQGIGPATVIDCLKDQLPQMHISKRHFRVVPEGKLGMLGEDLVNLMDVRIKFLDVAGNRNDPNVLLEQAQRASNALRERRRRDFIPLGLLTVSRAARQAREFARSRSALHEAKSLIAPGKMELYDVDCLIEHAWLSLQESKQSPANGERIKEGEKSFHEAKKLVEKLAYGRRMWELSRLQEALRDAKG